MRATGDSLITMQHRMKAAYLDGIGTIQIREGGIPTPGPNDVLIRVRSVGICASDIHYFEHGRIGRFVVGRPLILGHEPAGDVVTVGADVTGLVPGDRVSIEPGVPCQACAACASGRYNLCPDVVFMATPPVHGAFAEYVAHPAARCFKIPDAMCYDAAALIEPLSVGLYAAERGRAAIGDRAAILGAGPIGLMTLLSLRSMGVDDVTVVDVVAYRLEKAREIGASRTLNAREQDVEAELSDSFDVVFETAGNDTTVAQTIRLAARGGRVVLVGLSPADETPIDTNQVVDQELDIAGVFRYAHTWPKAIALVASGRVDLAPLVSSHYALDDVQAAMEFAQTRKDQCIKVMVTP